VSSAYRLLRALPPVLHEAGVAVAVAVSLAPELVVSVGRVRAARRLRGRPGGITGLRGTVMPVLEDALERSLHLASSMDVRGYGRRDAVPDSSRRLATATLLGGMTGLVIGSFAVLDGSAPAVLRLPLVAAGAASCVVGLGLAGRRIHRTVYRPDPWRLPVVRDTVLTPSTQPLAWPAVTLVAALPALFAVAPTWLSPPLPTAVATRPAAAPVLAEAA